MSEQSPTEPKAGARPRAPLIVAFVVVACVLGAYWLYVRGRNEYFVSRNLRMLSSFAGQLDTALASAARFVGNYAAAKNWNPTEREKLLPQFSRTDCTADAFPGLTDAQITKQAQRTPGEITTNLRLAEREGVQWLQVALSGLLPLPSKTRLPIGDYKPSPVVKAPVKLCRQIALAEILEPLLNRERFGAFDTVFLANAKGDVLYSVAPPHASSTLLWSFVGRKEALHAGAVVTPKFVLTNLGAIQEATGFLGRSRTAIDPRTLRESSRHADVEISGDSYVLFTHPYAFRSPSVTGKKTDEAKKKDDNKNTTSDDSKKPATDTGKKPDASKQTTADDAKKTSVDDDTWVVGGLVGKRRFQMDVRAVSASKAALGIALCILAICAWPFLRISLMTSRHPLTITDVVLVTICSIVGIMLLTLVMLDWNAYQRIAARTDDQLETFAYKMERDFTRDVVAASKALDAIAAWSRNRVSTGGTESNLIYRAAFGEPGPAALYENKDVAAYPYFSSFAWIDRDGMQQFKATAVGQRPLVNVSTRNYFKDAKERHTWDAHPKPDGTEQHPYALEWVQSLTTGKTEAVMAKNSNDKALPVISLTTPLIDVNQAVLPPGTSFAIVNEQGDVLYHADEQRIGHEDFFAETDLDRDVRGAVLSRSDALVTASYWGEDQRMFVHPLANTPWTVIVFRSKRLVRAINIEALLLTILALAANSLPYFFIAIMVLAIAPWYRAPSLWPDRTRKEDYGRLTTVLALAAIALLLATYAVDPRDLVPLVALLPAQAVLSGYVLLHRNDVRRMSMIALTAWVAATVLVLGCMFVSRIDTDLLISAKPARMRWLLVAAVVFESVVALKMMTRRRHSGEPTAQSPSIESIVTWAFLSGVAVLCAWRAPLPQMLVAPAPWLHLLLVLLVVLASVMVLRRYVLGVAAAGRRRDFRQQAAALLTGHRTYVKTSEEGRTRIVTTGLRNIRVLMNLVPAALGLLLASYTIPADNFREVAWLTVVQGAVGSLWIWRNSKEIERLVIRLIWSALTVALLFVVAKSTSWLPADVRRWAEAGVPMVYFVSAFVTIAIADGRSALARVHRLRRMVKPLAYPFSYRLAGVLTLMVAAALPTVAYFKVGSRIEQEALVKYAQLRTASAIEQRVNQIGTLICGDNSGDHRCLGGGALEQAKKDALKYPLTNIWDTVWHFDDRPPSLSSRDGDGVTSAHDTLARLIPQYSEDSVAMRQLYAKASADPLWNWTASGRLLTLQRLVRLDPKATQAFWPGSQPHQQSFRFTSYVPLLFPTIFSIDTVRRDIATPIHLGPPSSSNADLANAAATLWFVLTLIAFAAMLVWIVNFITDRVLLLNVQDPLWVEIDRGGAIGDHVFLTRRQTPLPSIVGLAAVSDVLYDVRLETIDTNRTWDTSLREIDVCKAQNIRILDFEYKIDDPKTNLKKLIWLERVIKRDRTVLVVSEVTPSYVLGLSSTPRLEQRWKALLGSFLWLTWDEVDFRRQEREQRIRAHASDRDDAWTVQTFIVAIQNWRRRATDERRRADEQWLLEETASSRVLRHLAGQLDADIDRQQILDELQERAEQHYDSLWSTCAEDEKLLLFHLARHGFVQAKNRRTLRRVMARGLVRRGPNLELFSETFRAYVLDAGARENLPAVIRKIESEGTWRTLRGPIFVVIISFLLLLFTTQKDLLTLTTGFAAAMTTGLPVLVNFFGMFTQRRLETAAKLR
jgi:hypothetical protein